MALPTRLTGLGKREEVRSRLKHGTSPLRSVDTDYIIIVLTMRV